MNARTVMLLKGLLRSLHLGGLNGSPKALGEFDVLEENSNSVMAVVGRARVFENLRRNECKDEFNPLSAMPKQQYTTRFLT